MNSSEFNTEHLQPTIEYGPTFDNIKAPQEVPEVRIVAEADATQEMEVVDEFDTSSIPAPEYRGYEEEEETPTEEPTIVTEAVTETNEAREEVEVEEPATEGIPHEEELLVVGYDEGDEKEIPRLVVRETEDVKKTTVGEILVERLLDYLEGDEEGDKPAVTDKPVPAAAAEVVPETPKETEQQEVEEPVAEVPEVAAEQDQVTAETETVTDVNAVLENVNAVEETAGEDIAFVDPALGGVAVSGSLPGEVKGEGEPKPSDIRELVEQSEVSEATEAAPEAAEEQPVDVVMPSHSPLGIILSNLPSQEATVRPPVVNEVSDAVTEVPVGAVNEGVTEVEIADDSATRTEPVRTPTYSYTPTETAEARTEETDEVSEPVAPQGPQLPKLGPELPAIKGDGRLSRILEGIGTGAAVVGAIATAGISAGTLPARLAKTKIDDRQVKHEGLFTYKITVQGGGKSQTITVTSPFGKTFAKFQARVKFARDKLAP